MQCLWFYSGNCTDLYFNIFLMEEKPVQKKARHPLLDVFGLLINEKLSIRLRGLKQLLAIVANAQKQYQVKTSSSKSQAQKNQPSTSALDPYLKYVTRHEQYSPELEYTLLRLVRGLGTSDDVTRLSFSTALTEVFLFINNH